MRLSHWLSLFSVPLAVFGQRSTTDIRRVAARRSRSAQSLKSSAQIESLESRALLAVFNVTADVADGEEGSLRHAVEQANNNGEDDEIQLAPGIYSLPGGTLNVTEENHSLSLVGSGQMATILDGQSEVSVLSVQRSTLTVKQLSIINGMGHVGAGGAISNFGTLMVESCDFLRNQAPHGGAIYNEQTASIRNSNFFANTATVYGGAIDSDGGELSIFESRIIGNIATYAGGGLRHSGGPLTVDSTTFMLNATVDPQAIAELVNVEEASGNFLHAISTDEGSTSDEESGADEFLLQLFAGSGLSNEVLSDLTDSDGVVEPGDRLFESQFELWLMQSLTAIVEQEFGGQGELLEGNFERLFDGRMKVVTETFIGAFTPFLYVMLDAMAGGFVTKAELMPISEGGGIALDQSQAKITNSTIALNASRIGGGLSVSWGEAEIWNSTLSTNFAKESGGGLYNGLGEVSLKSSTVTNNRAEQGGGLFQSPRGPELAQTYGQPPTIIELYNTIIAGNQASSEIDFGGNASVIESQGSNLIGIGVEGLNNGVNRDLVGSAEASIDPLLGPLDDNGGLTPTHALLDGSPAIDAGPGLYDWFDPEFLIAQGVPADEFHDQRGVDRPQDGNDDGVATYDIGAFERRFVEPVGEELAFQSTGREPLNVVMLFNEDGHLYVQRDETVLLVTPTDGQPLTLTGTEGNDRFVINLTGEYAMPVGGIFIQGLGHSPNGADELQIHGSISFDGDYVYSFADSENGTLTLGQKSITFHGIEQIEDVAAFRTHHFVFGDAADQITLSRLSDLNANGNSLLKLSAPGTAPSVTFIENYVQVESNGGDDTLSIDSGEGIVRRIIFWAGDGNDSMVVHEVLVDYGHWTRTGTAMDVVAHGEAGNDSLSGGSGWNYLSGDAGNDTLRGGSGPDQLTGDAGNDSLFGGAGDDTLHGGLGRDALFGEDGDDIVQGQGGSGDTVSGGFGRDTISGGAGEDLLLETGTTNIPPLDAVGASWTAEGPILEVVLTNTSLVGLGDDETDVLEEIEQVKLVGNVVKIVSSVRYFFDASAFTRGAVTLQGGEGNDTLIGSGQNDSLDGGGGTDQVQQTGDVNMVLTVSSLTGRGNDKLRSIEKAVLTGGDGNNTLDASLFYGRASQDIPGGVADLLLGGPVTLIGGAGNDVLIGGLFGDQLLGNIGNDTLTGGGGDDLLAGGGGHDAITGGDGNDTLIGAAGNDNVSGGLGDDVLNGGLDNDVLDGGDGNDLIAGKEGHDKAQGGAGNDTLKGDTGNDTLSGGEGEDEILGGDANDVLHGDAGEDNIQGGTGNDRIAGGLNNDLIAGGDGNDTISGGDGDDALFGQAGNDHLLGEFGNDTISGGTGNDSTLGGAGKDLLMGDEGDDFLNGQGGRDTIVPGGRGDKVIDTEDVRHFFGVDLDPLRRRLL